VLFIAYFMYLSVLMGLSQHWVQVCIFLRVNRALPTLRGFTRLRLLGGDGVSCIFPCPHIVGNPHLLVVAVQGAPLCTLHLSGLTANCGHGALISQTINHGGRSCAQYRSSCGPTWYVRIPHKPGMFEDILSDIAALLIPTYVSTSSPSRRSR